MKVSVNLLCVVLLLLGAGLVFAGRGMCVIPEPTTKVEQKFTYYPSGRPWTSSIERYIWYYDGRCEGMEGACSTVFAPDSLKYKYTADSWLYNDTDDDATKLQNCVQIEDTDYGLTLCGNGEPIIAR